MLPYRTILLTAACIGITFSSCVKEPEYPVEPVISLIGMDKNLINNVSDSIKILLSFTDGDADLSFQEGYMSSNLFILDTTTNPNTIIEKYTNQVLDSGQTLIATNVLLTDSRTGYIYNYTLPFIELKGNIKNISGEIEITFKGLTCRPFIPPSTTPLQYDTLTFDIQILDRADHISNTVTTSPIVIDCF